MQNSDKKIFASSRSVYQTSIIYTYIARKHETEERMFNICMVFNRCGNQSIHINLEKYRMTKRSLFQWYTAYDLFQCVI